MFYDLFPYWVSCHEMPFNLFFIEEIFNLMKLKSDSCRADSFVLNIVNVGKEKRIQISRDTFKQEFS